MTSGKLLYPLILVLLWSAIFVSTITRPALLDDADSFHAEAVREMVQSGDWVTLRINNGVRYLEKAPFMYWTAAVSVSLFGLHDWSIRLPSALFSLLLILLTFTFGQRFWGRKGGFYAGLVIATCLGHYAFTRIFLPDVILSFFAALSLYLYACIVIEGVKPKYIGPIDLWSAGIYVCLALALITKGLIGIVFPCGTIFFHILITRNWKVLKRLQIGYGILIFLIVAAPWHIAATLANPDFLWFYFIREHVLRFLGMRYPKDSGSVPRLLFWGLHLLWLFPWSAFIWGLVRNFPRSVRPQTMAEKVSLLVFLWIGVILIFFTFGATQEYYTFPSLAAFALLIGKSLADLEAGRYSQKLETIGLGIMAILMLAAGAALIALTWVGNHAPSLSATLTTNPDRYYVAFGHIRDLTPATFSHLSSMVLQTAAVLILGPCIAFIFAIRKRWMVAYLILAFMMVPLCRLYNAGMVAFEPVLGSKSLANTIQYHYKPEDKIVINDFYEKGSTLNYYTGLQVYVLDGGVGVLWYGLRDKTAPKLWLSEEELLTEWKSGKRIFFFSEKGPLDAFLSKHPDFEYRQLAEDGGKKILINW